MDKNLRTFLLIFGVTLLLVPECRCARSRFAKSLVKGML